jgi:hypothetical protein
MDATDDKVAKLVIDGAADSTGDAEGDVDMRADSENVSVLDER